MAPVAKSATALVADFGRPARSIPLAAAASAAKREPSHWLDAQNRATAASSRAAKGAGSPIIARRGRAAAGGGRRLPSWAICTRLIHTLLVWRPPRMLRVWAVRKKAAPISAASTWATVRVRLGPIRLKRAVASSRPQALALRARAARTTRIDSQRQCPTAATGSRGGVINRAKAAKAFRAMAANRTVSTLRGAIGAENSRSRSPRL